MTDDYPAKHGKYGNSPKRITKASFLALGWILDIKKWFAKWNMVSFLDREEVDWKEVEKSFKVSLWEK